VTRGLVRSITLLAALLAAGTMARAQAITAVADFSDGPGSGSYSFASSTPANLADLVDSRRPRPAQTALGHLSLPAGSARVPAVLLVHGSGGVYPELQGFWTQRLNALGIATFVIDIFGPRGVLSTVEDQSRVPMAADVADAFAALALLASHPRIAGQRIAVMGFSRGGTVASRTAVQRIAQAMAPDGLRFAAHVPVYSGGCAGQIAFAARPGVFGPAPMLFVHGEDDDYASAADCQAYAARIAAAGTPATYLGLPGARHKFDASDQRRYTLRQAQKTRPGCPLAWDIAAMAPIDSRSDERLTPDQARAIQREHCSALGATVEGDTQARDAAAVAIADFLRRVLEP
jgi:dienelactone hydrolase